MSNVGIDSSVKAPLLAWLPEAPTKESMDVDDAPAPKPPTSDPVPEAQIYLQLLLIHYLLTKPETYSKAMALVKETVSKIQALNRRSMDPIAAKVWYAVERTYELAGDLAEARPYVQPKGSLVARTNRLSDYFLLLRGPPHFATMMKHRHHLSTDCFATTFITACTTKLTNWCRRLRFRRQRATLSLLVITITLAVSKPYS